jgi:hypothetical protein
MTIDGLVEEMVEAASNYQGIDKIMYRTLVENIANITATFVGIVAVALAVFLPIILALELAIINFPPLTLALVNRENYVADAGVEKKRRNWGLFVNDARKALRMHAETQENINLCYFRVKWITVFTAGISMAILFSKQESIVRIVTKAIGPILLRIAAS